MPVKIKPNQTTRNSQRTCASVAAEMYYVVRQRKSQVPDDRNRCSLSFSERMSQGTRRVSALGDWSIRLELWVHYAYGDAAEGLCKAAAKEGHCVYANSFFPSLIDMTHHILNVSTVAQLWIIHLIMWCAPWHKAQVNQMCINNASKVLGSLAWSSFAV